MKDEGAMKFRGDARFTILDAMAMVAAAAAGVALSRAYYEEVTSYVRPRLLEYRDRFNLAALSSLPFVAALAWCRLRRPHLPTRRLAREPGVVVLLATAITIIAILVGQVLSHALPGPSG